MSEKSIQGTASDITNVTVASDEIRPLRLGMVGGGRDAFIGAVHRIAARMDNNFQLVAGALSSTSEKALASAADLGLAKARAYSDFRQQDGPGYPRSH